MLFRSLWDAEVLRQALERENLMFKYAKLICCEQSTASRRWALRCLCRLCCVRLRCCHRCCCCRRRLTWWCRRGSRILLRRPNSIVPICRGIICILLLLLLLELALFVVHALLLDGHQHVVDLLVFRILVGHARFFHLLKFL